MRAKAILIKLVRTGMIRETANLGQVSVWGDACCERLKSEESVSYLPISAGPGALTMYQIRSIAQQKTRISIYPYSF